VPARPVQHQDDQPNELVTCQAGRWDVALVGSAIGAVIGITEAILALQALLKTRRSQRPAAARAASGG
jgi:hypothetical protein